MTGTYSHGLMKIYSIKMSRSRKKNPFSTYAGDSNKQDKRKSNRAFRRLSKVKIIKGKDAPMSLRDVSNIWCFAGDGKFRAKTEDPCYEEIMRK